MTSQEEERLMLVAVGMAIANKQARKKLDLRGTPYEQIIGGLCELPDDATHQQQAQFLNDQHALKMFLVTLGFDAQMQLQNLRESPMLVLNRANQVSLWSRAKRWLRATFAMIIVPAGDVHAKIEKAKALGYRDDSHKTAVGRATGVEGQDHSEAGAKDALHGLPVA